MKKDIHPTYYPNARVQCICGHAWQTGSTIPKIDVEICSNCHPFYTGREKILDTAGRVDRFRKIVEKSARLGKERSTKASQKGDGPEPKQ
ncbi:50S ribosomal protein L31 [Candidatus Parcubacteria bacterium]|nr:50S ribosomal protein L31 [Candidatus Parcubacteria bacterium]